jgi:hypothetical protein
VQRTLPLLQHSTFKPSMEKIEMSATNLSTTGADTTKSKELFPLGRTVATPGALEALEEAGQMPAEFLRRHQTGDWASWAQKIKRRVTFQWRMAFAS